MDSQRIVKVEYSEREEICVAEAKISDMKIIVNYPLMAHMVNPAKNEIVLTHLADR